MVSILSPQDIIGTFDVQKSGFFNTSTTALRIYSLSDINYIGSPITLSIKNSLFMNCNIYLEEVFISIRYSEAGSIFLNTGILIIDNCVFGDSRSLTSHTCHIGARQSIVSITNSQFFNAFIPLSYNLKADERSYGGSCSFYFSNLYLNNCSFGATEALHGGHIFITHGSNALIMNSYFKDSITIAEGSQFIFSSNASYINCKFNNNTARIGGSMYFYFSRVKIAYSVFNNSNAIYGSFIFSSGGILEVKHSEFSGGSSYLYGGIFIERITLFSTAYTILPVLNAYTFSMLNCVMSNSVF